jgi:diaminohydroxyphosphoribosylaminopyrimidine deaminase/5-amino-6-(5-phosphoribosylamino)uracil reductase
MRRLREGGVEANLDEARYGARARRQNAPFLKYHETRLPLVTYKAAVTLDGKVAAAGGDARWISCLESRRAVHGLRSRADAVMVGVGTVRQDDPELTVRLAEGRDPVRVVITRDGVLPWGSKLLATARRTPTIVSADQVPEAVRARLSARGAEVLEVGPAGLRGALQALAARGLLDVLCEGGPTLAGELLAGGLLDRVLLFVAPLIVGRGAPDLFAAPAATAVGGTWRLTDVEWSRVCDDLMLSGNVTRSES